MLKRIVLLAFFISLCSAAFATSPEKSILFVVSLTKDSNATLENYFVTKDFVTPSEEGNYSFELLDEKKTLLYKINTEVVFHSVGMPYGWSFEQSKDILEDTSEYEVLYLIFPYSPAASYFRIKKEGAILLEEKINLCNYDGVCNGHENSLSCPDCSTNDAFCVSDADGVCDTDCLAGADPDCKQQTGDNTGIKGIALTEYLTFALLFVIGIIIVYNIVKRVRR